MSEQAAAPEGLVLADTETEWKVTAYSAQGREYSLTFETLGDAEQAMSEVGALAALSRVVTTYYLTPENAELYEGYMRRESAK